MENNFNIWFGLLISFGMVCVMKYIAFRKRKNPKPFKLKYWLANNWAEYPVYLFLTWLVFSFDDDFFNVINYILKTVGSKYRLIHFENNGFWFVVTPVLLTWLSYRFLRKETNKFQQKVAPDIHHKHCNHE